MINDDAKKLSVRPLTSLLESSNFISRNPLIGGNNFVAITIKNSVVNCVPLLFLVEVNIVTFTTITITTTTNY